MSDYLDPNNEELLKDFFSEAQMQVETLEQNILVLENEGHNRDAVDEIFRAAHTLKGGAATVEMHELSSFTHLVEDVLDAIRSDQVPVNEDIIDVLLLAIDIIKEMLDARMKGTVYHGDSSAIEQKLSAFLSEGGRHGKQGTKVASSTKSAQSGVTKAPPVSSAPSQKAIKSSLTEYDILEMRQAAQEGTTVYRIAVTFNEDNVMNTVGGIQVFAALKGVSTVLRTVPEFEQLYEDIFHPVVEYYVSSNHSPDDLYR
ncbi:MAG TPA: Hpt domain-containing protein, partial [Treponema sp.]|nr:Hpt domain-containing protein [Treponema sp.]HPC71716.1 Hpt domain-containing protein [Treponema sp.]HRU28044.1 Hpt domain-containing protein [Treponema sp.]